MNFPEDFIGSRPTPEAILSESRISHRQIVPSLHLRKLLVPTDFSENSKKALIYAVRLAQRNNSSLILFHVFEPPEFVRQVPQDYSYESHEEMRKLFDTAMRRSAESLETLSETARKQHQDRNLTAARDSVRRDRQGRERKGGGLNRNRHPWLYRPEALLARQHSGTGRSPCALSSAGRTPERAGLRLIKNVALLPKRNLRDEATSLPGDRLPLGVA